MKSKIDLYWNERAKKIPDDIKVNIPDTYQRDLEWHYIIKYLKKNMNILEVGCGNGMSTDFFRKYVKHVDAFDYSEDMIARAKQKIGEKNNKFIHDNLLNPKNISKEYDAIICVRALINLSNFQDQKKAINNLGKFLKSNGVIILAEGIKESFTAINDLRKKINLSSINAASVNCYIPLKELLKFLEKKFIIKDTFHLGMYDYLTRIFYPSIVGQENVKHNTIFSEQGEKLARAFNPDSFEDFSRVRGFILKKK